MDEQNKTKGLDRYLSRADVWAMAFGCMVGWGRFCHARNDLPPGSRAAGTLIAMLVSMGIILVIGCSLAYLMGRSALTGGVYAYTKSWCCPSFLPSWGETPSTASLT